MLRNRELEAAYKKVANVITEDVEISREKSVKIKDDTYRNITAAYTDLIFEGDYKKNTTDFINDLLKSKDLKGFDKFLNGLKDFLDENGFLTNDQQKALGSIKGNLAKDKAEK